MGLLRGEFGLGWRPGVFSIWRARSGDALIKNQPVVESDPDSATLDCVCGAIVPSRAARQLVQEQFH